MVAIVTGASGAIGSATVRAFAARGTDVVLAALESERETLESLAVEARSKGVRALVVPTDVTKRADIDRLVAATLEAFGTIDALANVAGIGSTPSLCDETDENIERVRAGGGARQCGGRVNAGETAAKDHNPLGHDSQYHTKRREM